MGWDESGNGERKQRMGETRRQSTQLYDGEETTLTPKTLIYPSLRW